MYSAKILADSIAPCGKRLTTWELTYPRFVHAELMTHRLFSRNSASSRAIPAKKLREMVIQDPAMPLFWGKNQKGMQATEELSGDTRQEAMEWWLKGMRMMARHHDEGELLGIHKQIVNRIIEPWMFITIILTSTEFDNWFKLRDHPDAQPEIAWVAGEMRRVFELALPPRELKDGEWHLPLVHPEELLFPWKSDFLQVVTGRCARVSYLTHDGRRDYQEDIRLFGDLSTKGHWSPFEHPAQAMSADSWDRWVNEVMDTCKKQGRLFEPHRLGNFVGFKQFRKIFQEEHVTK